MIQLAAQTLEAFFTGGGNAREHAEFPLDEVRLLAPVQRPPSVRDFYAFEEHVRNARAVTRPRRGRARVVRDSGLLLLEPGRDLRARRRDPVSRGLGGAGLRARGRGGDRRGRQIGGFTVMNDWSARDLQRKEMKVGLGPAKGKDFATSLGPVLVTPDELGDLRLEMVARVNGEERSRGNLGDLYHSWESILAPGRAQHGAAAGRRDRLRHGRHGLHPRARRRALAAARRRSRARGRGDRRPAQHHRLATEGRGDRRAA